MASSGPNDASHARSAFRTRRMSTHGVATSTANSAMKTHFFMGTPVVYRIVLVIAMLFAIAVYVPIAPLPPEFEPDLSFRVTTYDAFARHLLVGRDLVSTYGPWGLLQRGYDPRTDAIVLGVSTLLALSFVWGQRRNPFF